MKQAKRSATKHAAAATADDSASRPRDASSTGQADGNGRRSLPDGVERDDVECAEPSGVETAPARRVVVTPHDVQIADAIAGGLSNKEIATKHGVTPNTIKTEVALLARGLGVRSRSEIVYELAPQHTRPRRTNVALADPRRYRPARGAKWIMPADEP
jgi:DNA-binding NarL/FixJ family response regulator